jgi:hypothetical protein
MLALFLLAGCSARVDDYHGTQPGLDLREYFNGRLTAWGQFQDRSGKVVKRFTVELSGTWKGDEGRLDEAFIYDDGSRQTRTWYLKALPDGHYEGRAADVVGVAVGEARGSAMRWRYTLALPVDGTVYHVQMDDWMYLQDRRTLINRTTMSKFGIRVGEITLFFRKEDMPS